MVTYTTPTYKCASCGVHLEPEKNWTIGKDRFRHNYYCDDCIAVIDYDFQTLAKL